MKPSKTGRDLTTKHLTEWLESGINMGEIIYMNSVLLRFLIGGLPEAIRSMTIDLIKQEMDSLPQDFDILKKERVHTDD